MKKMKNLFMAVVMFGLLLVPTLNAENETKTTATIDIFKVTVDGKTDTLTADETTGEYTLSVKNSISSVALDLTTSPKDSTREVVTTIKKGEETITGTTLTLGNNTASETLTYTITVQDKAADSDETDVTTATKKEYTFKVVRAAKVNAQLKALNVYVNNKQGEKKTLTPTFVASTKAYTLTVPYEVETIFIEAEAETGSTIVEDESDVEAQHLYVDEDGNSFTIKVTSVDEEVEYTLNVTRSESTLVADVKAALATTDYKDYKVGDETIDGKDYVAFAIESTFGKTKVVKGYVVEKTKDIDAAEVVKQFEEVVKKPAYIMYVENYEDYILNEDVLTEIRNNGGTVYVSGYDASWELDGSKITDSFKELNLKVLTNEDVEEELRNKLLALVADKDKAMAIDFKHSGNLPKGTKVGFYVGDKFEDGDTLTLYYYSTESGKLRTQVKNIKVEGAWVEIEMEHCSSYVLALSSNNAQTGPMNVVFYIVLALASLTGIIFLAKKKAN